MSIYFGKGKGWRYDFTLNWTRYTESGFKTKTAAKQAESQKREEIQSPKPQTEEPMTRIDMAFLELVNRRLDYVKAYNSERHYTDHVYQAKKWARMWGRLNSNEITAEMIQAYLIKRCRQTSGYTANKDLRQLRALFNFAMHPTRK